MKKLLIGLFFLFLSVSLGQVSPPAERVVAWSMVGTPGGVPTRTGTVFNLRDLGADHTGRVPIDGLAQSIASQMQSNQVMYLPEGCYLLTQPLMFNGNGLTIQGDGPDKTIIINNVTTGSGYGCIQFAVGYDTPPFYTNRPVVGSLAKGATQATLTTLDGAFPFAINHMVSFYAADDPALVYNYSTSGSTPGDTPPHTRHIAQITGITGNTITFTPPTYIGMSNVVAVNWRNVRYMNMARDFAIDNRNPRTGFVGNRGSIFTSQNVGFSCVNVWHYAPPVGGKSFYITRTLSSTFRGLAVIHAANGSRGPYAFESYQTMCNSLVEDCTFIGAFPGVILSHAANGNVIAYNYSDYGEAATGAVSGDMNGNHGPMNLYNLFEGNDFCSFQLDGYHGNVYGTTVFRNWARGIHPVYTLNVKCIDLCRGSWETLIWGNVLGTAGYNWIFNQTTNNYPHTDKVIMRFGYPGMGSNTYNVPPQGNENDRQLAIETQTLALLHGNYSYHNNAASWNNSWGTNLVNSLYLSSQPAWWPNGIVWPPFGPDGATNYINARWRAMTNNWGLSIPSKTCPAPITFPRLLQKP